MQRHARVFPDEMDRFTGRQLVELERYVIEVEKRERAVMPDG